MKKETERVTLLASKKDLIRNYIKNAPHKALLTDKEIIREVTASKRLRK